jgi:hypothetical protein
MLAGSETHAAQWRECFRRDESVRSQQHRATYSGGTVQEFDLLPHPRLV